MKKYEFKNYVTHRSAEVHVDVPGYEGIFFVQFIKVNGKTSGLEPGDESEHLIPRFGPKI